MQSKTLLQSHALGAGDSPAKPTTQRSAEELGFILNNYGMLEPKFIIVKNHSNGGWLVHGNKSYYSGKIPKVTTLYENPADQKVYRELRKEGRTAADAREVLRLMGVEPQSKASVPDSYWSGYTKQNKAELPHYHYKRRF